MKKIQVLEEKISKVIDKIKSLTKENEALNEKVFGLKEKLAQKDKEMKSASADSGVVNKLKTEIEKLNNERDTVRSQVEKLLKELESVEL